MAEPTSSQGPFRRTWRMARGWYASEERAAAWGLTAATLVLTLAQIGTQLRLNLWHRDFFNALEQRDPVQSSGQVGLFLLLAALSMAIAVSQLWARQMLALRWRRWLVHHLQERWLADACHYRMGLLPDAADNPDQRISENTRWATVMAVDLATGLLHAVLTLVSFAGVLWVLSSVVRLGGVAVPGSLVLVAVVYALAGGTLTWLIGRPLVDINIRRNQTESDHRFALVRLRESAEAVALIRGGRDEATGLRGAFARVVGTMHELLRTERQLMWLGSGYGMVAAVVPLLLASPVYFAGALTLGALMQLAQAFVEVVKSLSWFQENWPRLADWRSHVERIVALEDSLDAAEALGAAGGIAVEEGAAVLAFEGLELRGPDGAVLVAEASAVIRAGERVLIQGESGTGKSTLFRAAAGLWPWGSGRVRVPPREAMMILPQRPYLPLGTLREAVSYPAPAGRFADAAVQAALIRCGLPALVGRLDEQGRWDRSLSLGQQQRIGFARLLLHRPDWILLDEATSAVDEAGQAALMGLFAVELVGSTLVSIGHRDGLVRHHDRVLRLVAGPAGARMVDGPLAPRAKALVVAPLR
ncbi:ABC transporter ATP-binding protein/permease [Paeniroseomonas aquatica]|uniref:ABC transporter ATP-binding protein/permease n=1 Tax=Paeniroseomonas aquatica TaxID=373043 RepID=A0ABT8A6A1_9PROT|nr:ABC transporter ATP-binding protein/permease [Paeniroseomonas aquatica]MDN3565218.1 ABC transporter ATP-binding protein/permease [Paeniroseomonas aquatica]